MFGLRKSPPADSDRYKYPLATSWPGNSKKKNDANCLSIYYAGRAPPALCGPHQLPPPPTGAAMIIGSDPG
eukprot:123530-Hanusia_phi.AAC.1